MRTYFSRFSGFSRLGFLRVRVARTRGQDGFTLVELVVALVVLAILLGVAVPSYLLYRDRAKETASKASLGTALVPLQAYYAETGSYDGLSSWALRAYDAGLSSGIDAMGNGALYCIQHTSAGPTYYTVRNATNYPPGANGVSSADLGKIVKQACWN